jgi:heme/copper-type cytochrome/quinol oxidase subunit 2
MKNERIQLLIVSITILVSGVIMAFVLLRNNNDNANHHIIMGNDVGAITPTRALNIASVYAFEGQDLKIIDEKPEHFIIQRINRATGRPTLTLTISKKDGKLDITDYHRESIAAPATIG